jgi:hypothetical protein|tara:strand:- start:3395 stop:3568 length:174 start_codon:yes stop_codon:yes gene_type:complete
MLFGPLIGIILESATLLKTLVDKLTAVVGRTKSRGSARSKPNKKAVAKPNIVKNFIL